MPVIPAFNPLTSSAFVLTPRRIYAPKYNKKQDELWDYYDRLVEFQSAVSWKANAMSRVRLVAAEIVPGSSTPEVLHEGPAAELVSNFAGGVGGQSQIMRDMTTHLSVPGEGWLIGEYDEYGAEVWQIYSAEEFRISNNETFQVKFGPGKGNWRELDSVDSVVLRFWESHPRRKWEAVSPAQHALGAMMELDLINKRIIAEIVSRLASNGILLYDKGKLSLPNLPPAEGAEAEDPFAALLVEVGSAGIKDPLSPSATLPIPIGYDLGDLHDINPEMLMRLVTFAGPISEKLLEQRESAKRAVAVGLDVPADQITGVADLNHWNLWKVEEQGVKIHIAPTAETICHTISKGYLVPGLEAGGHSLIGPSGGRIVTWYDPADIIMRPDRSDVVRAAYDRLEASGEALRRESGLSETDKPTPEELEEMIEKLTARRALSARRSVSVDDDGITPGVESDESIPDTLDDGPEADE